MGDGIGRGVARWTLVAVALAMAGLGCGGPAPEPGTAGATSRMSGPVVLAAAASLTDVVVDVEAAFEVAHPDVDVVTTLGGSASLRAQLLDGAPVDVFVSADVATMDQVVAAGLVEVGPEPLATNRMHLAVPVGNPGAVTGLGDLADDDLFVGLCATGVPCGDYAREVLAAAGVDAAVDTEEPDVRSLLAKVAAGELDVGITYVTDVAAADGRVEGIAVPDDVNVVATVPIARLVAAPNPTVGSALVDFMLGDVGRGILADHGFGTP